MQVRCVDILRDSKGNLPRMLKNLDPFFMLFICNEWMNKYPIVRWHEIVELCGPKDAVGDMSLWHLLQPKLYRLSSSCRCPQSNLLLFGPEGSGKMLFAQGIAGEAKATFFHFNAASLETENLSLSMPHFIEAIWSSSFSGIMMPEGDYLDTFDLVKSLRFNWGNLRKKEFPQLGNDSFTAQILCGEKDFPDRVISGRADE
ncbi:ATPase family AAA domain-containing protein FIGL1-like [Rosa rugosa]|uniref:ATPase family AAA domain-containing protein FIGL1-like n=1 Tax=Rosa rugosa TaxID=74645 RepID=UPI002B406D93|nr:ATPase family AAA domain-containing protein FIGL1-like [Rosa rugosa]